MTLIVVDASLVSAWCFPDEQTDYTNGVLKATSNAIDLVVPRLWNYEICNSILTGVRRKRISRDHAIRFFTSINDMAVRLVDPPSYDDLLSLADSSGLTAYDASYLDLALREKLPLATLDKPLRAAAAKAGIILFKP